MYNWYLLSLQSFNIHTAQVAYILYIALPLLIPTLLTWRPPAVTGCPPQSQVARKLSPFVPHCSRAPLPLQLPSLLGFPRTQCAFN
jgi:hypothetical protein